MYLVNSLTQSLCRDLTDFECVRNNLITVIHS